jgi:uncharacterized protein (TIGR04255 family)
VPPRPPDLPDYERPPIDEVVLGVQFHRMLGFSQAHVGLIWNEIRDRYPRTEDQPPIVQLAPGQLPMLPITLGGSGLFRVWMISGDDTRVLQVQNDRILHNWRRRGAAKYPRFEQLVKEFTEQFNRFERLIGPCALEGLEVTYINWLPGQRANEFFLPARTRRWSDPLMHRSPSAFQWSSQHGVGQGNEEDIGTLSIACNSAARPLPPPPTTGTQFTLTFNAPVQSGTAVRKLMETGRDLIVRSFTDLTTKSAQESWGRIQ